MAQVKIGSKSRKGEGKAATKRVFFRAMKTARERIINGIYIRARGIWIYPRWKRREGKKCWRNWCIRLGREIKSRQQFFHPTFPLLSSSPLRSNCNAVFTIVTRNPKRFLSLSPRTRTLSSLVNLPPWRIQHTRKTSSNVSPFFSLLFFEFIFLFFNKFRLWAPFLRLEYHSWEPIMPVVTDSYTRSCRREVILIPHPEWKKKVKKRRAQSSRESKKITANRINICKARSPRYSRGPLPEPQPLTLDPLNSQSHDPPPNCRQ